MPRSLPSLVALVALLVAPWSARDAVAQERPDLPQIDVSVAFALASAQPIRLSELDQHPVQMAPALVSTGLSAALKPLYVSTAVLQGLDVHSTMSVLNSGGAEANPLMAGMVRNKAAFIGVKAAVATGTILIAHQIGKRNKLAAVVTLVAINSVYAFIVQHNYRVARSLQ